MTTSQRSRYAVAADLSSVHEVTRATRPSEIVRAEQIPVQAFSPDDAIAGARWYCEDGSITVRALTEEQFVSHEAIDEPWSIASPPLGFGWWGSSRADI